MTYAAEGYEPPPPPPPWTALVVPSGSWQRFLLIAPVSAPTHDLNSSEGHNLLRRFIACPCGDRQLPLSPSLFV